MEKKIAELEQAMTTLTAELKQLGEAINSGFTKTDNNFDNVSKQLLNLRQQLDLANRKIDLLKGETTDGFGEVGIKLENLTEEITKIGKVTGYDESVKNLEGLN